MCIFVLSFFPSFYLFLVFFYFGGEGYIFLFCKAHCLYCIVYYYYYYYYYYLLLLLLLLLSKSSANELVGTGFAYRYRLQPRAGF